MTGCTHPGAWSRWPGRASRRGLRGGAGGGPGGRRAPWRARLPSPQRGKRGPRPPRAGGAAPFRAPPLGSPPCRALPRSLLPRPPGSTPPHRTPPAAPTPAAVFPAVAGCAAPAPRTAPDSDARPRLRRLAIGRPATVVSADWLLARARPSHFRVLASASASRGKTRRGPLPLVSSRVSLVHAAANEGHEGRGRGDGPE